MIFENLIKRRKDQQVTYYTYRNKSELNIAKFIKSYLSIKEYIK